MLMKVLNYLHDCFKPPREFIPMTDVEMKALTNLIQVSKERLWIAESYPKRPTPSFDYTENLEESDLQTINNSIKIVCDVLNRQRHTQDSV